MSGLWQQRRGLERDVLLKLACRCERFGAHLPSGFQMFLQRLMLLYKLELSWMLVNCPHAEGNGLVDMKVFLYRCYLPEQ